MRLDVDLVRRAVQGPAGPHAGSRFIDVSQAKPAAVVVPLRLAPEPSVVLVLRGSHLKDHAGEVGFPGGKPDPGDADLRATALRELEEEVGLAADEIEIVGELRPMPVITGRYMIHPFAGVLRDGAAPRVSSPEIARVLELPLWPLLSGERTIDAVHGEWHGVVLFAPHFELDGCVLYGASAYILHDLLSRLAAGLGLTLPAPRIVDVLPWGDRYTEPSR
jgi:8-oxo-dGTP pyrophosphatase MutT (NUDIX family)